MIDAKTERISDQLGETSTPAALLRKIESPEQERADIQRTVETAETATRQAGAMREISEKDARVILNGIEEGLNESDRDNLKEILRGLIDRIVLDSETHDLCIDYKTPVKSRNLVASPTRFELVLPP